MRQDRSRAIAPCALLLCGIAAALAGEAGAEQASQPEVAAAAGLDAGANHTCALLGDGSVRCWGFGGDGQLGYGNRNTIGDDETPGSVAPVDLGLGATAVAISAGDFHTCALLVDGSVRCWGFGADGRLGYGNTNDVGDDEPPGSIAPVNLGSGRTARAISAGGGHTCALLDDFSVRCWGYGGTGQLGYGNLNSVGDNEVPSSVAPVNLGVGRTARAITAGGHHTCALLDDGSVRCWGLGLQGRLGYGNTQAIGDTESPGTVGPVNLGPGRTAVAISAGQHHTCARLDDGTVRCWGYGATGRLGYGNIADIGDDENPGSIAPVDLGAGRSALAISAAGPVSCARLEDGAVRCWGYGADGRLGYASTVNVGDDEAPGSVRTVDLGAGSTAAAISTGGAHTCARLDDGGVRCWGYGANGRLGYCNEGNVGDDETPGSIAPVALETPGSGCNGAGGSGTATTPGTGGPQATGGGAVAPPPGSQVGPSLRPGSIAGLRARAASETSIKLSFRAPGTNGSRPPPARTYLVRQSRRPIRSARDFSRAQTLCKGSCRFVVPRVGTKIILTITDLTSRTTYYYAVAARDNASKRVGPRSKTVKVRTR